MVGNVLLGGDSDGSAMMQGVIACPFVAPHLHEQRARVRTAAPTLGIGDSLLLYLWEAWHASPAPP